jgi:hypothetical protein
MRAGTSKSHKTAAGSVKENLYEVYTINKYGE